MNPHRHRILPIALLLALAVPGAAQAQPTKDQPAQPKDQPTKDATAPKAPPSAKATEWPALAAADRDRTLALAGQLKKDNDELRRTAREGLIAIGPAAAPLLFQQVSDKDEGLNAQLFLVFDAILAPAHATLLAREAGKNKATLRPYLMRRMCAFVDPELAPVLKAATKDKNAEIAFCGNLGLLALRDTTVLPAVIESTRRNWAERVEQVSAVLPAGRCEASGTAVGELIAKAETPVQAAGLRLLRYLATRDQTVIVRPYLQAEDHGVRKEAVNAMRVLHGEAPIENLSAFQAIEMAKEWLKK